MCHIGGNRFGALILQRCSGIAQRPGAITDIVDQDALPPGDVTDDVHHFGDACPFAALINDREIGVKPFGKASCAYNTANIG